MALSPIQVEISKSFFEKKTGKRLEYFLFVFAQSMAQAAVQEGEEKYENVNIEDLLISMIQDANVEGQFQNKFEQEKISVTFNDSLETLFAEHKKEDGLDKLKEKYIKLLIQNLEEISPYVEARDLVQQAEMWLSSIRTIVNLNLEGTDKDETKQKLTGYIDNLIYNLIEWGLLDKAKK